MGTLITVSRHACHSAVIRLDIVIAVVRDGTRDACQARYLGLSLPVLCAARTPGHFAAQDSGFGHWCHGGQDGSCCSRAFATGGCSRSESDGDFGYGSPASGAIAVRYGCLLGKSVTTQTVLGTQGRLTSPIGTAAASATAVGPSTVASITHYSVHCRPIASLPGYYRLIDTARRVVIVPNDGVIGTSTCYTAERRCLDQTLRRAGTVILHATKPRGCNTAGVVGLGGGSAAALWFGL